MSKVIVVLPDSAGQKPGQEDERKILGDKFLGHDVLYCQEFEGIIGHVQRPSDIMAIIVNAARHTFDKDMDLVRGFDFVGHMERAYGNQRGKENKVPPSPFSIVTSRTDVPWRWEVVFWYGAGASSIAEMGGPEEPVRKELLQKLLTDISEGRSPFRNPSSFPSNIYEPPLTLF